MSPAPPGMLGGEERQFLYFAARDFYAGAGEIVDAGAFLGASAGALAAGLRDNPRVRDKFRRTAVKGDICGVSWPERDIEILFVDFTHHWRHHEAVARSFYRHMMPGRSLLIHQDYVYTLCYWLHIFMEFYRDSFDLVSPLILNGTAAWIYTRPLPPDAFEAPLNERLSFPELLALFDRSLAGYNGTAAGVLRCARGRMLLHGLGPDRAREYVTQLEREYAGHRTLSPHVALLADEIDRWPRAGSAYEGFYDAV